MTRSLSLRFIRDYDASADQHVTQADVEAWTLSRRLQFLRDAPDTSFRRLVMFLNVQPIDGPPRLVNVNHIVQMTGDTLVLSNGSSVKLSPESVLRVHALLPKVEP